MSFFRTFISFKISKKTATYLRVLLKIRPDIRPGLNHRIGHSPSCFKNEIFPSFNDNIFKIAV
uniref:Uncharacterized protein n=1 Tax=Raoultella ornithinolytica TaxID=54291 RepID=A0A0M5KRK2_RAOOR|nr:hypothetical protein [Raoultella ornithinolytica]